MHLHPEPPPPPPPRFAASDVGSVRKQLLALIGMINSDEVRCQIRCELPYPDELEEVPLEQGDFERVRTLHS